MSFYNSVNSRYWTISLFAATIINALPVFAHDWHRHDDPQFANLPYLSPFAAGPKAGAIKLVASTKGDTTTDPNWTPAASPTTSFAPATLGAATLFAQTFVKFNPAVRFWWDSTNFYVEGDGTPAHSMMEGISSWQRQLPLPTYYFGTNIWALPLYPVAAATNDLVATNKFTQGAIALAANGIPIFNPYNNTGRISAQIGELDYWGGHCGRGDDYHYHAAPLHLTNTLGTSLPLAFAMDGYPVFGLVEPDGSPVATNTLDNVAGHTNGTGSYHYHASASFPYVNGGFHGVITIVTNGAATQAGIQPTAKSPRPSGTPLAGAYIQIFTNIGPDQFQMFYSQPSNSSPAFATNYWLFTLNRAGNSLSVTYSSYDGVSGPTTTNYNNWKPAPAFTSTNEPLVTTQPTNLTLAAGSTATFSITAAGLGSLAYQWFKDGVELANGSGIGGVNTATLSLTNVQAGDVGAYTVVVTNTIGNTMSGTATLALTGAANTPPTLTALSSRIVIPGQTLLITNVANDAETPGLLTFSLSSSLPGPTINATNGLITWLTTTNNASSTNQLTVVVADNGSPNLFATQSCTVTVVDTRSISQGLATTITSNLFPAGQRVSGVGTITAFDGTIWTVPAATPFASSLKVPDLWNQNAGVTPTNIAAAATAIANLTTNVIDADGEVITGYIFCDNYFELFINGVLVGVDPVPYTPFNSCVVKFKAKRPITYAVRLVDWEENLGVGTELNAGDPNHSGDGGFIASFSDGTVTGPNWKAQSFYIAPLDNPNLVVEMPDGSHSSSAASNSTTLGTNAYALHYLVPTNWFSKSFNHSNWPAATTFTEAQVGVNNQWAYLNFPAQFGSSGAQFIWSKNLVLDNEVIVRFTGPAPATNTAPVFTAVSTNRYVINGGDTLVVTNAATDADLPAQTLTYSLLAPPAGATINTNTGVVTWITTTNNSGTSNLLQVVVTDSGSPNLSATNSFTVFVRSLKPNVFIIVTDDQGYGDISAHGGLAATPNMDRLGSEGIRLERFYPTPVCSVTRSTLMTGRNPVRTSVNNTRGLDLREHMMPVTFKAAGYQTYMCGKWHLGGLYNNTNTTVINGVTNTVIREGADYQPQARGWDTHYGEYTGAIGYSNHVSQEFGTLDWWLNGQTNLDQGWSTDLLANKAIQLFQQRDPSKPAIVYLAFNAVHGPVSAPASYLSKYPSATGNRKNTLAALDQMDEAMGRVLNAIDAEGVTTNTLVVYFSDNGGQAASGGSNLPLRGDKGDLFDGGIHTPAAVRWPGVLPSGVTNCQQFMWSGDWFPTICAATGVTPLNTKPFDGVNMWPLLMTATNGAFNPTNYRGSPLVSGSSAGSGIFDVFSNGTNLTMFKLIRDKLAGNAFTNYLFDIINDPYESNDVVNVPAYSNIVATLSAYYSNITAESYSPYIGAHPQSQTVPAGNNVTLWAMTTVYPKTVTTQWRKNGTNIVGQTNRTTVDTSVYLARLDLTNVSPSDAGTYDLLVTDNAVGWPTTSNSLPAILTVTTASSNTAPVLTPTGNRIVNPNTTLLVTNVATDAEAPPQTLTFSLLTNAVSGANIDVNTGLFTWTPTTGQANTTNSFIVVVTDNGTPPLSASNSFSVTVLPAAPVLVVTNTTRTPLTPASSNTVTVTSTVTSGTNITSVTLFFISGGVTNTVTMFDDGLHGDGAAGNSVYGGQIPAKPAGTTVSYYVRAQDAAANSATDPAGAPGSTYSYTVASPATGWSMLKLPDTGQTADFTALPGEDSDYLTNAPSYTDNGNGTISDNITGLMWQKVDSGEISWTNALAYAVTNNIAGFTDWRLPTIHELHSIVSWAGNPPQFNTTFFTLTQTGNTNFWWTSETRVGATNNVWNIGNGGTVRSSAKTDTLSSGGTNYYHARLVRGAPAPTNAITHNYTTNGDGTVTDVDTGLMWVQAEVPAAMDWSNALIYAEGLTFAGYTDWRLPNIREMRSLNDEKVSNPSASASAFPSNKIARYWSATTQNNRTTNAWYVDFQFGNTGQDPKILSNWVRVVRGPVASSGPANTPPVLTQQPDRTVAPTYTLIITNVATDAEVPAQTLTYSLISPPANASINATNGVFTFTPVLGQLGSTNTITVVATDSGTPPLSATNSFKAIVIANTAPLLAAISDRTNNPGDTVLITNVTTDAEAPPQTFTYALAVSPSGATINPTNGLITWATTGANAATTNDFTVVVSDNGVPSLIASRSFKVVITGASGVITYDILLGRPTATSIAASVLASNDLQVYFEYGTTPGVYTGQTTTNAVTNAIPQHLTISGLLPNQRYYYRMRYSATGGAPFSSSPERTFATQRARGSTFSFLIEADPHNRDNVPAVWKHAFTNMLADNADFLLDLGDTFFEEKVAVTNAYYLTRPGIFELHQEVRNGFFGLAGHSLPLFLVSGNHDPELGWLATSTNNPAVWGVQARQYLYPVPVPSATGFYSGSTNVDPYTLAPRDAYYAFEWGDALFISLDPYWYSSPKPNADGWSWTLGTNQYAWLKKTLETSTAKFKFVFAHHLIGGGGGGEARGGLTYHDNFEWGGYTTNGGYDFPTKRPGWAAPIKDLLLSNNVQAFFHGHDHLYVKEEYYKPGNSNGIPDFIYQEVPQPSQTIFSTNAAAGYAYTNANSTVIASSGHLRVTVSPTNALVEYVRVFLPANEGAGRTNRMISHSYNIPARVATNGWSMLKLPDTGQTTSYTTTPGEDSDYSINPQSFTDNGNGTTTDNVTGLMWQKADGGEMTLANALLYPTTNLNASNFAGYNDWRMPTVHELLSILNQDRSNPALDTNYFTSPGVTAGTWNQVYWWSKDQLLNGTNQWCANAGGGVGPKPLHETISAGGTLNYRVRAVRGVPAPTTPRLHYVNNGNGTVTDIDTGLTWQQSEINAAIDWTNALNYAESLVLAGFQDWRLPNIKELESLNDETRGSPSTDTNFFPGAKSARYWSSTTQNNAQTNAWWNEFITGITSQSSKTNNYWVRAVRGGLSNTPPVLATNANYTINAGVILQLTNAATDAQTAPGFLTFSLLTSASNASLGSTNGLFSWRPAVAQAGTTNAFTVVVADTGSPVLNATQTFLVTVNPLLGPSVTHATLSNGVLQLLISGDAGPDYTVQASTNLSTWTDLFITNSPTLPFNWVETNSDNFLKRFYRVILGP